ncbi:MAG TPA: ribosomal protein S18-alanine N-acetyltransferase, partial [Acidobacteriota bacterium]|nr:ribosomal protein S18-alanine N-acetyltransferase [Acidobacteriota bacterium]
HRSGQIRPMTEADVPAVVLIERASFGDPWPESAFREMLAERNRFNLVLANEQDEPLGYLCAQCVADEVQIHNIAVAPDSLRRGIGRRLLAAAEAEGLRRGAFGAVLDVRGTNTAALAMYGRFGYRRIGRRRNYYVRPRGDALILFKPLIAEVP